MKKYILLVFFTSILFCCSAQEYTLTRKVVPILSEQSFYLNGGIRSGFGGKSRVYYKIDLPPNTIEWYYSFTTSLDERSNKNLRLAAQLTRAIDQSGITEIAAELLLAPPGTAKADIYLCDRQNTELFMQKVDNSGGTYRYYESGSRQNFSHGVVPIKREKQGTWYLCIKNPSASAGLNVTLEVTAIVGERQKVQKDERQTKAELYTTMGWNAYQQGDYVKCIEMSNKCLELDPNQPVAKCNIALCYLIQNNPKYLDYYIDAISCCKRSPHPKEYLQLALKDIHNAKGKIPSPTNAEDIMTLIKQELNSQ